MFLITSNDFILAQMMLLDVTLLLEVFLASMILHSLSGGLLVRLLTAVLVFLALLALEPLVWMLLDVLVGLVARPSLDSSLWGLPPIGAISRTTGQSHRVQHAHYSELCCEQNRMVAVQGWTDWNQGRWARCTIMQNSALLLVSMQKETMNINCLQSAVAWPRVHYLSQYLLPRIDQATGMCCFFIQLVSIVWFIIKSG